MKSDFSDNVIKIVKKIPAGKTLTYKEVAERAGNGKAARAVGNILNKYYFFCKENKLLNNNSDLPIIPCHRVVRSDGKIGGYALGGERKKKILADEKRMRKNILT